MSALSKFKSIFHRRHQSFYEAESLRDKPLEVPNTFLSFERSMPMQIRYRILNEKIKKTYNILGFLNDYEVIDCQTIQAKNDVFSEYLNSLAKRQSGAISAKTQLLEIEDEIARITQELSIRYEKLDAMNTVYRNSPPPSEDVEPTA